MYGILFSINIDNLAPTSLVYGLSMTYMTLKAIPSNYVTPQWRNGFFVSFSFDKNARPFIVLEGGYVPAVD